METMTLFRPVGPEELALIKQSGWKEFPPRLPEQPIFYPVLNEEYATQIARDWNVKASGSGFVTRFEVEASVAKRYPVQVVGGSIHEELWVPAEDLPQFNRAIVGPIRVIAEFHARTSAEIRSREALCAALAKGATFEYLLFWGHTPGGRAPDKSCLSQWFPATFVVDGVTFPTAEHFMMMKKAELFGAREIAMKILATPEPRAAKALGRKIANFDDTTWTRHREAIVIEASFEKFRQNAGLRSFLLGTSNQVLVEASPTDSIWGIGLDARSPAAKSPASWPGLNLLGFALMEARHRLR
jgi:ribA/ribD-fused uncharacterized protein